MHIAPEVPSVTSPISLTMSCSICTKHSDADRLNECPACHSLTCDSCFPQCACTPASVLQRITCTMARQSASLSLEIAELESSPKILTKWEQKRLHTMRQLLTRNTAALAVYALRVN